MNEDTDIAYVCLYCIGGVCHNENLGEIVDQDCKSISFSVKNVFLLNKSLPLMKSTQLSVSMLLFYVPFVFLVNGLCLYFPGNEAPATPAR